MAFLKRKPTRIPGYEYSTQNYYFITICTHEKKCIFGVAEKKNAFGIIAEKYIEKIPHIFSGVKLDKYVVMPNHIHMILAMDGDDSTNICTVVGQYKAAVTKQIRLMDTSAIVWQRSFHDHIIRSQKGYEKIWDYIENNPLKWSEDCFYCEDPCVGEGH